ncbi:hypothetical protein [Streptomyces sp. NPDC055099]
MTSRPIPWREGGTVPTIPVLDRLDRLARALDLQLRVEPAPQARSA